LQLQGFIHHDHQHLPRLIMPNLSLTNNLREEYEKLFNTCTVRSDRLQAIEKIIAKIGLNRLRYENVTGSIGVPWFFVAVIHSMEGGLSFDRHLHNGDPLLNRTVHIPAGRPKRGKPPFTWEESACDALTMRGLGAGIDWGLPGTLYQLERYNGWGYRLYHSHVPSPYLWSFSQHYTSGKYTADGTWSDTAVSKQCGAAVLIRRMAESNLIEFPDQPAPINGASPLIVNYSTRKAKDPAIVRKAAELQRWLNTFPGIFVLLDGVPGIKTSDAYKKVTGMYLPGDPRSK
jgi:lysozyme family protein